MSNMKTLLETVTKFSFANPKQKPGDQWRGTDASTPGNKLVGESDEYCDACDRPEKECVCDLSESLMLEYRQYSEAAPIAANTAATTAATTAGTPAANTQPAGTTVPGQPPQPGQPPKPPAGQQPNPVAGMTPQQILQQKQQLSTNLSQLKAVNPTLNVPGAAAALSKDPNTLSTTDAKNLKNVATTMEPAMLDKSSLARLKGDLNRLNQPR